MILKKWEELPKNMQTDAVFPYWKALNEKKAPLLLKRGMDILFSTLMLLLFSPVFLLLAVAIRLDSPGPVFYRQERVTRYGRVFRIHKFRSMCDGADKKGTLVTVSGDSRVTRVGRFIRKYKLDELPQLLDVWKGDMSFVGTRPEVRRYVDAYTPEMMATLLLPAGITSTASIRYKDENALLDAAEDVDRTYIGEILPEKMKWNLEDIRKFSPGREMGICVKTVLAVFGRE